MYSNLKKKKKKKKTANIQVLTTKAMLRGNLDGFMEHEAVLILFLKIWFPLANDQKA